MTRVHLRLVLLATAGLFLMLGSGCASNPADRLEVAEREAARMTPPSEPLSRFQHFELWALALAPEVEEDAKKVKQAGVLEQKLKARIQPLIDGWDASGDPSGRTLLIQPTLQQLRIVSGGARFWVGGMAGESIVDLDLRLVEKESGREIGRARVVRSSSAMAGGWSVGATDRNLPNYIVDICHEYLRQSHSSRSR
jgi:hypothetical protein